jgi:hypothetical protein
MAKNDKAVQAAEAADEVTQDTFEGIGGAVNTEGLKEVDLFATLPSFVADKNWVVGRILAGKWISSKKIFSDKFSAGSIDKATGKKCRMRHILEDAKGNKFVIWGLGGLDIIFKKLRPMQYVELTYTGKAAKPIKVGQSCPHEFTVKSNQDLLDLDDAPESIKETDVPQ